MKANQGSSGRDKRPTSEPTHSRCSIHITDAPFNNSPAHPSPPFDRVAGELRNKGILQIGLATWGKNNTPEAAEEWLSNMATETGTVAPGQGVDCDEDGEVDIGRGEPLVCVIADEEEEGVAALAPPILATLRALTDKADVSLVPMSSGSFIDIAPADLSRRQCEGP